MNIQATGRPRQIGGLLLVLITSLLSSLSSCGYRNGLQAPLGRTVGVEVFLNESTRALVPDLERDLSDAIGRAVLRLVHAELVDPRSAEMVVRGEILDYRRRRGIRDFENRLLETDIRVAVKASLESPNTGATFSRTEQAVREGFVLGEFRSEREARVRTLDNLAERIVLDLFANN